MSARSPKLNFAASVDHCSTLDRPEQPVDWAKIEAAYGCSVPQSARVEIVEATNKFLQFSAFALAALPLTDALKRVEAMKRCATDLLITICERSESAQVVDGIIEKHTKSLSAGTPYDLLHIADVAGCLIAACEKTKRELVDQPSSGPDADERWRLWVRRITAIAKASKLPRGVRKDRLGNPEWRPSPFVRLVDALQTCLPSAHRRRATSHEALSQAITAARAEYRRPTKSGE
jgi:hypothetical protein